MGAWLPPVKETTQKEKARLTHPIVGGVNPVRTAVSRVWLKKELA